MIDSSIKTFLTQLFETLGEVGFLAIILGVELLFILIFAIKTVFSYEARLKRSLNKLNKWLFTNKKIDENNIKEFNTLIKKGPKRLAYYWHKYSGLYFSYNNFRFLFLYFNYSPNKDLTLSIISLLKIVVLLTIVELNVQTISL